MGATNIDTLVCPPAIFMGAQVLYGITALLSLERTKEGILIQYVHGYGRQPTIRIGCSDTMVAKSSVRQWRFNTAEPERER